MKSDLLVRARATGPPGHSELLLLVAASIEDDARSLRYLQQSQRRWMPPNLRPCDGTRNSREAAVNGALSECSDCDGPILTKSGAR